MEIVNQGMDNDRGAQGFETDTKADIAGDHSATARESYSDEEVKKLLQSEGDRRVNQAIESFRKTEMEKLVKLAEEQAKEKNQSEQAAFMSDYNGRLSELNKRALRIEAQSLLAERGLPASLIEVIPLTDEAELPAKMNALESAFRLCVERGVNERLRASLPETAAASRISDRINRIIGIQ